PGLLKKSIWWIRVAVENYSVLDGRQIRQQRLCKNLERNMDGTPAPQPPPWRYVIVAPVERFVIFGRNVACLYNRAVEKIYLLGLLDRCSVVCGLAWVAAGDAPKQREGRNRSHNKVHRSPPARGVSSRNCITK